MNESYPEQPVALITGAGRGIGLATAHALHEDHGARVCVADLELGAAARELASRSEGLGFADADVRSFEKAREVVAAIETQLGRLDFLVLNAGIARDAILWKMSPEAFAEVLAVHLGGAFHYLRAAVPLMRQGGFGRIVAVSSINGLRGKRGLANYSAAKAGLLGLIRTVAREVGRFGITANAVAPGYILTDLMKDLPEEVQEAARQETCLGHLGEPEDVAWAISFLCSPRARHVSGAVLVIDGGQTA